MEPSSNRFKGNVYIFIDGWVGSSTGHFASLVKHNSFATLIGEESGSTYTTNDGSKGHTLSHTGISYRMATMTFTTTAKNLLDERGVFPEHHIAQNISDFLDNKDTVLQYTLDLIKKEENE